MAQWVGHHSAKQTVTSLISGQGTLTGLQVWSPVGAHTRGNQSVFISHVNVSLPLFPPPLKINKIFKKNKGKSWNHYLNVNFMFLVKFIYKLFGDIILLHAKPKLKCLHLPQKEKNSKVKFKNLRITIRHNILENI